MGPWPAELPCPAATRSVTGRNGSRRTRPGHAAVVAAATARLRHPGGRADDPFEPRRTASRVGGTGVFEHMSTKDLTSSERFETAIISRAEPSRAEPSRAEPSRAEPSRAEPSRAEPSRAEPSRAEPSRAEPSRAEPSRAEPSRAEPSRAEPSRAEPSRAEPSRAVA